MKPNVTPEEATESFRHFLKQHDNRLEHLMALGPILEELRIGNLSCSEEKRANTEGNGIVSYQDREISLHTHEHEVHLITTSPINREEIRAGMNKLLLQGQERAEDAASLRGWIIEGETVAFRETDFSEDDLADMLDISSEGAEVLTQLLLFEFNVFQQFFQ